MRMGQLFHRYMRMKWPTSPRWKMHKITRDKTFKMVQDWNSRLRHCQSGQPWDELSLRNLLPLTRRLMRETYVEAAEREARRLETGARETPLDHCWLDAEAVAESYKYRQLGASERRAWAYVEGWVGVGEFNEIRACTEELERWVEGRLSSATASHADDAGPDASPSIPPPFEPKHEAQCASTEQPPSADAAPSLPNSFAASSSSSAGPQVDC